MRAPDPLLCRGRPRLRGLAVRRRLLSDRRGGRADRSGTGAHRDSASPLRRPRGRGADGGRRRETGRGGPALPGLCELRRLSRLRAARRGVPGGGPTAQMTTRAATAGKGPARKRSRTKAAASAGPSEYSMLLTATLCLLAFGAVMVFSASSTTQVLSNGGLANSAFYLKRTVIFGLAGLLVMRLLAVNGVRLLRSLTPLLLGGSLFLLVVVLRIGSGAHRAAGPLGTGVLPAQPPELVYVRLDVYGA